MKIPKGITMLSLRDYSQEGWVEESVLCEVEILMVAFSKQTCRVRFTPLEDKAGYKKCLLYKNKDLDLTPDIMKIILSEKNQ